MSYCRGNVFDRLAIGASCSILGSLHPSCGEPPLKYLTRWRMHKATHLLKNDVKMEKIAQQLGYDSDVAFRKAFKREVGIPPARYRTTAQYS